MSRLSKLIRRYFPRKPGPPGPIELPPEAEIMLRDCLGILPKDGIFLDLGANFGFVTAIALEYGHKVYAFEPDPFPLAKLRRRFGDHSNVTIIPKAVGAQARRATFFRRHDVEVDNAAASSSLNRAAEHFGGSTIEVEVVDFLEFLKGLPAPPVMVKMDIEGAEAEVLEAMIESQAYRDVGLVLVEPHYGISRDITKRLESIRSAVTQRGITNINMNWM